VIKFQIKEIRTTKYHKREGKRKRAKVKINVILSKNLKILQKLKIVIILNNLLYSNYKNTYSIIERN